MHYVFFDRRLGISKWYSKGINETQRSLGIKFQVKLPILTFWTKFTLKGYFWSKKKKWTSPLNSAYLNCSRYQISAQTNKFEFLDKISPANMMCIYLVYTELCCCMSFRNNRTNIVAENPKALKILPFYRKYTIAWRKIQNFWVNPKKSERRKKTTRRRFTIVNVITVDNCK